MAFNNTNTSNLNNTTSTGGVHHNTTSSTGGVVDHVKSFLTSSRKEDTTEVCTETAPAVVQEHVERIETVDQVEAIDRERHIHHHQHRIQPIVDHVELPTEHKYQIVPEVVRESKHDMLPEHREKLEQQRQLYHDTREVGEVKRIVQVAPAVAAEHVHHHVHETIQPVINRETIQKTHVHTTIPIHEKIHDAPIVHEHTVLPTVSLRDFEAKVGGTHLHKDASHQHAYYEGSPRVGGGVTDSNTTGLTGSHNHGTGLTGSNTHGTGLTGSNTHGTGLTGSHNNNTTTHGTGLAGAASALTGNHNNTTSHSNHGTGLTGGTLPNTGLGAGDHTLHDSVNRGQYDARDANHDGKVDRHEKKDTNHDGRVDSHDKKTGLGGLIASVTGKQ